MRISDQIIHLPRFAQPWIFLGATNDCTERSPFTTHSLGSCRGRGLSSLGWGLPSSFTTFRVGTICLGTLPVHPAGRTEVAALDAYVSGITQQSLISHLAWCNSFLLQSGLPCHCCSTRHYGTCLVPTHASWAHLPRPMRLQATEEIAWNVSGLHTTHFFNLYLWLSLYLWLILLIHHPLLLSWNYFPWQPLGARSHELKYGELMFSRAHFH